VQIRPADVATTGQRIVAALLEFCVDLSDYLGVILPIMLSVVLLLIVTIMLVGRLIGVSQVTTAFCWSILLAVMLFPHQALLNSGVVRASAEVYGDGATTQPTSVVHEVPDVRIPGALYTWPELVRDHDFARATSTSAASENPALTSFLKWCRYVIYPLAMLVLLVVIHLRSRRGLRFALGEAEVPEPAPAAAI
jgi:hypothetical protein